jgi:hypothetical protein
MRCSMERSARALNSQRAQRRSPHLLRDPIHYAQDKPLVLGGAFTLAADCELAFSSGINVTRRSSTAQAATRCAPLIADFTDAIIWLQTSRCANVPGTHSLHRATSHELLADQVRTILIQHR